MAVPELACIAGFCIMLYWCSVGSSAISGRLVSCNRRIFARCCLAYKAK
jgi:hypothetical protein